jgi:hypothetical protein
MYACLSVCVCVFQPIVVEVGGAGIGHRVASDAKAGEGGVELSMCDAVWRVEKLEIIFCRKSVS